MNNKHLILIFIISVAAGYFLASMLIDHIVTENQPVKIVSRQHVPTSSPVEYRISAYLKSKGIVHYADVARACVAAGKDPYLLAAMAVVECGNPHARGAAGEIGAWQVLEKHHGKVPADVYGQAVQAEWILRGMIAENNGSIGRGIYKYNGRGRSALKHTMKVLQHYEAMRRG